MDKKKSAARHKTVRRSPWPRGSWIHPKNNPLSELPDSHPAKLLLFAHWQCRRDCVGREIGYRGHEEEAFDQVWKSQLLGCGFSFSSYAYVFISFDLILEEWLTHPSYVTESEKRAVAGVLFHGILLDECEQAAKEQGNVRILERLAQVRKWHELRLLAIKARWVEDNLEPPEIPAVTDPFQALGLTRPGS